MLPLHRLTQINLEEARDLGLLTCTDAAFGDLYADLNRSWSAASDEIHGFWDAIDRISDYSESMTWLEFIDTSLLVTHRVTTVKNLLYPLRGTLEPALHDIEPLTDKLESLIRDIETHYVHLPGTAPPPIHMERLRQTCDDLRTHLCCRPAYLPAARISADTLHSTRSNAWFVRAAGTNIGGLTCQGLRDALGLIHLPDRRSPSSPAHCLVQLSFALTLSGHRLPAKFDPDVLKSHTDGLWLVRPTICHSPNERFVQRHSGDPLGGTAPEGRTINISNSEYKEGLPELILVHGQFATLEWSDLLLLTPPPCVRPLDDDHNGFLQTIADRLGHLITP